MTDQSSPFVPTPSLPMIPLEGSTDSPQSYDSERPVRFLNLAAGILIEYELPVPGTQTLAAIVSAALGAQYLFFSTALHEPTQIHLDLFVEDFVLRCVSEGMMHVNAIHQSPSEHLHVSSGSQSTDPIARGCLAES
jgi:hypothetical protein